MSTADLLDWAELPRPDFAPGEIDRAVRRRVTGTAGALPRWDSIWSRVRELAASQPDATAVRDERRALSYAELTDAVAGLAARIEDVEPGQLVAVLGPLQTETVIALLAVEAVGGIYLPVGPQQVLSDVTIALSTGPLPDAPLGVARVVDVREVAPVSTGTPIAREWNPQAPAYVVRTAGSAAEPKAVVIEYRSMVEQLRCRVADLGITPADRIAATSAVTTRASISQLLTGLVAGAETVIPGDAPGRLSATVLELSPREIAALLREEAADNWHGLRLMISTGSKLPPAIAAAWHAAAPQVPLVNAYGSAETSVVLIDQLPPTGNCELYLLNTRDSAWRSCEPGETGELFVGGPTVGPGYLADGVRTRGAFFQDSLSERPGGRLHRTGDLFLVTLDGHLEYQGRADRQTPDEVEMALLSHSDVRDCAVVVQHREQRLVARAVLGSSAGDGQLVAYVVGENAPSPAEVHAYLAERLPAELLPDDVLVVGELPVTSSGGIAYTRLAESASLTDGRPAHVPPRTPEQVRVCEVWAQVLQVEQVGLHDSFFMLGGDSLQALRIIARLRGATGKPLTVRDVLLNETPEQLAAVLTTRHATQSADTADKPANADLRLSAHQAGVYFQWLLAPDTPYYSYQGTLRLHGSLDEPRLRKAWQILLAENPSLLVRFSGQDSDPVQNIPYWTVELGATVDLDETADAEQVFAAHAQELAERAFDLRNEPLLRTTLYRFAPEDHRLLVTMHEILLDGWGALVFFERLGKVYGALAEQPDLSYDPRRRELFTDYLRWQERHHDSAEVQIAGQHWETSLAGTLPVLDLPTDRPRPAFPSFRGGLIEQVLPSSSTRLLNQQCAKLGITPFMLMLGAFSLVLTYYAGEEEVIVGAPMANRDTENQVDIVGFLLNMLPLRVAAEPTLTVTAFLDAVRQTVLDGLAASDYPFASILRRLPHLPRSLDRSPLFQVMLNMLNYPVHASHHDGVDFRFIEMDTGFTKFDCALYVQPHGSTDLLLQLAYQTDLFDEDTAQRLLASVVVAVDALAGDGACQLGDIDLLPASDRQLLHRFTTGG